MGMKPTLAAWTRRAGYQFILDTVDGFLRGAQAVIPIGLARVATGYHTTYKKMFGRTIKAWNGEIIMDSKFPPPLPGKNGWPWDFQPEKVTFDFELPRVTIVTPSYNHADYLEETIRSVLLQGYPHLEYFVIDGGSTDGSIDIIRKYQPWLAGWISERDAGQSSAINKGFAMATGEWMGWLNSDDCYAPYGIYNLINTAHTTQSDFVYGSSIQFGSDAYPYIKKPGPFAFNFDVIRLVDVLDQPTTLWRREVFEECGPMLEDLHFAFDWEFFIKCARKYKGACSPSIISAYRLHGGNKTLSGDMRRSEELIEVSLRYIPDDIREKFIRALPYIRFMTRLKALRDGPLWAMKWIPKLMLVIFSYSGLLRCFGLPMELWSTHGISNDGEKKLRTFQRANIPGTTLSEALDCFHSELIIPALSD